MSTNSKKSQIKSTKAASRPLAGGGEVAGRVESRKLTLALGGPELGKAAKNSGLVLRSLGELGGRAVKRLLGLASHGVKSTRARRASQSLFRH